MAYVTITELKTALGVGDLYPDTMLDDVIQTAESVLEPFLETHAVGIVSAALDNNQATFVTIRRHNYAIGQSVVITGTDYNGTYTVLDRLAYSFTVSKTGTDTVSHHYLPMGKAELSTAATYDNVVAVRTAAMMIAVDVFNSWTVPGGQAQGIDFQPGPYIMGRSILSRVMGLISRYRDVDSMIG
jgi:hypothetical protein